MYICVIIHRPQQLFFLSPFSMIYESRHKEHCWLPALPTNHNLRHKDWQYCVFILTIQINSVNIYDHGQQKSDMHFVLILLSTHMCVKANGEKIFKKYF